MIIEAQTATNKILLNPASAANTAAATSAWVSAANAEGDLVFIVQVGALTGTITPTFETASDGSGTGAVAIVPNEGAIGSQLTNTTVIRTIRKNATLGFVRIVGTIVTGPALCSASFSYRRKNF